MIFDIIMLWNFDRSPFVHNCFGVSLAVQNGFRHWGRHFDSECQGLGQTSHDQNEEPAFILANKLPGNFGHNGYGYSLQPTAAKLAYIDPLTLCKTSSLEFVLAIVLVFIGEPQVVRRISLLQPSSGHLQAIASLCPRRCEGKVLRQLIPSRLF